MDADSGQFAHLNFMLFNLQEMSSEIDDLTSKFAYPVSLVKRNNDKWSIVSKVTDYSVLIINGDSVAQNNVEYLGIL